MRKRVLLLFIALVVLCSIALSVRIGVQRALPGLVPMMRGMKQVDKLFPKPPVLLEYERIGDRYETGRIAQELPKVGKLATEPICLGSAKIWASDPDIYYLSFLSGRLFPASALIRRIGYANCEYAVKLRKAGRNKESLSVLITNLSIARQMVHMEPWDACSLLSGLGLWKVTWLRIARQMESVGDKSRGKRASACVQQTMAYLKKRVASMTDREGLHCKDFERRRDLIPKGRIREEYEHKMSSVLLQESSSDAQQLIKQWDVEVDTVACKQLIKELEKMSCPVSTH